MQRHPNRSSILGEEWPQSYLLPSRVSLQLQRSQLEEETAAAGFEHEQEEYEDIEVTRLCWGIEHDGRVRDHGKDTSLRL